MGLVIGIAAALLVTWRDILGAVGSWIFIGMFVILAAGLLFGYLAGYGRPTGDKTVAGLATALRNISAAIVVAGSVGGDTLVLALVGGLGITIVLIVLAGEIGRRITVATVVSEGGG